MDAQNYKPADRLSPSFICFLIWTFIVVARPMDYISFLMPLRPVLAISIITLLIMFFERPEHSRPIFQSTEAKLIFLLYFVMLAGVPFAVHRGAAFHFVAIIMPSVIIYFIVSLKQLNSPRKINTTVAVIAASILFSATLYIVVALVH
jgi:hypothetical protein